MKNRGVKFGINPISIRILYLGVYFFVTINLNWNYFKKSELRGL